MVEYIHVVVVFYILLLHVAIYKHCCFLFTTFVQVVWLCTCFASILLGLDLGLAVGLGVELISVVLRTQLYVSGHQHGVYKKTLSFCHILSIPFKS